jgi:hypothetical protein
VPDHTSSPYKRVVIAGHNVSTWIVSPPEANDGTFNVEQSCLGAHFLKRTLKHVLKSVTVVAEEGRALPLKVSSSNREREVAGLIAMRLGKHEITRDKQGEERTIGPDGKARIKRPSHAIQILEITRFESLLLDNLSSHPSASGRGKNRSIFPPVSFSRMPGNVGADTLAVVHIAADQPLPPVLETVLSGQPGFLILQVSAEQQIDDEKKAILTTYIDNIRENLRERFVVLTSSGFFAAAGFSVVDNSSWEAAADSLLRVWDSEPGASGRDEPTRNLIEALLKCPDVMVRHKAHGLIRFRLNKRKKKIRSLYYLVYSEHSVAPQPGFLLGFSTLLTGSLVRALVQPVARGLAAALDLGLKDGIYRCTLFSAGGYVDEEGKIFDNNWGAKVLQKKARKWVWSVKLRDSVSRSLSSGPPWSVLTRLVETAAGVENQEDQEIKVNMIKEKALEVARAIVCNGLDKAQQWHHLPVVRFGAMKVVDRRTFEDYWEIQESIQQYLRKPSRGQRERPLSLAVFGAPGGGKSYGVKQLALAIGGQKLKSPPTEVNVAQFTSVRELHRVFLHVRDVSLTGVVPLVFFDEFDASWEKRAFGWLRYFLAPMQDGEFGGSTRRTQFGKAIFIFVGGVNHSFEMFNGRMQNRDFIEAKGPDFVSRLARHLDVLGIDDRPDDDICYLIRRAVLIRDKLQDLHGSIIDPKTGEAGIDKRVVDALLGVPKFKHGVRSLEAIIQTSRVPPGTRFFHWGSLPPQDQLEMHVPVREFYRVSQPSVPFSESDREVDTTDQIPILE